MAERIRMRRPLGSGEASAAGLNPISETYQIQLAHLMHAAYRGTVDDEGETVEDALAEIRATLDGQYGPVIADASWARHAQGRLAAAIIVTEFHGVAFIAYVFTHPDFQRRGYGTHLIEAACARLAAEGRTSVDLVVTAGSQGEALYRRLGFAPVAPSEGSSARVLREDDPECAALLADGWTVAGTSWGARLVLDDDTDLAPYRDAIAEAVARGYVIRRLDARDASEIRRLDEAVASDFPKTDASHHSALPDDLEERLERGSWLGFGAFGSSLVGLTLLHRLDDRWEVDRSAVAPDHRGRGVAKAVKSASILHTYAASARRWGTGGASANAASLAMNRALGFELEPLWLTVQPPRLPA